MTFGQKLIEIRKKFGLSQDQFAEIIDVTRQIINEWENEGVLPDVSNLQMISKVFGITIDSLVNDDVQLSAFSMRKELDRNKYRSKFTMFSEVLNEYYSEPWEIFILKREKKMTILENIIDFCVDIMPFTLADIVRDTSPYYLVKKDNLKLLVNIKNYVLYVVELPSNIDDKKFIYGKNKFINIRKVKII